MRSILRILVPAVLLTGPCVISAQNLVNRPSHNSEEWAMIAPHLPDPTTASAQKLEVTGDVLRARRFPDDALTYYKAAAVTGGTTTRLLKKQGVTHLELQHGYIAKLCFQQAVHINRRDAEAWNNLGAADFMLGNANDSVGEYKRAVKLNRDSAIYHSNLSLAYFEVRNAGKARKELMKALAIDPEVLHHNDFGGYNLQVLAASHYAEICFEMARASALSGNREAAIDWLAKASERGYDVRTGLKGDPALQPFLQDERVKTMLDNQDLRHSKEMATAKPPSLPSPGAH